MSLDVFPDLPGLKWGTRKTPRFSTIIRSSVSGKEVRAARMVYPIWEYKLTYEFLRADATAELQTLVDFFLRRRGSFEPFLFSDSSDSTATAQHFGYGNGEATEFQLIRNLRAGGFLEPVMNLDGAPTIYADAVEQASGYTVSDTGVVSFDTAPAAGVALTWSGRFYHRCRFARDSADFSEFLQDLWDAKNIDLIGCMGRRI